MQVPATTGAVDRIPGLPLASASPPPSGLRAPWQGEQPPAESYEPGAPLPPRSSPEPASRLSSPRLWAAGLALGLTGLGLVASFMPGPPAAITVAQSTVASPTEAARHVQARSQANLSSGRMLKYDHYPTLQNGSLEVVPGAPNFRGVEGTSIYGVAQPTVDGLRNVLKELGADHQKVVWTTLREEPALYIQGRSVTLRELAHPFANLEQPGRTPAQVEAQEETLKAEVLKEAAVHGGRILLHEETPDGKLQARWVSVDAASLKTPREVFQQMSQEGFQVDYARIPVTDEKVPEEADFDALVARLKGVSTDTPRVMNCHAGRGRTTTAMVIADLMDGPHGPISKHGAVREQIKEVGRYENGDYRVILGLIRALEEGPQAKAGVDAAIDRTSAMQNLRTSIARLKQQAEAGDTHALGRGQDYLRRYFYLVSFNQYVQEQAPRGYQQTFSEWMKERPELKQLLENLQLAMNTGVESNQAYA